MTTLKAAVAHLKSLAHTEATGAADLDYSMRTRTISVYYPNDTAGATREYMVWQADKDCRIVSATILPCLAAAADNSDHKTLTLRVEDGAAGAVATVGLKSTDADATPAGEAHAIGVPLTIPITAANAFVDEGEVIMLDATHGGSGKVIAFVLNVVVEYV